MSEANFDFKDVSCFFDNEGQRRIFEQCATFVEKVGDYTAGNTLFFLETFRYLKMCESSAEKSLHAKRRNAARCSLKLNAYSTHLIAKYIDLPEMSQTLLDYVFKNSVFCPSTMLQIYNDEFIQQFFSVDEHSKVRHGKDHMSNFQKNIRLQNSVHEVCRKVSLYIALYDAIQLRVRFSYFVTQNINFDKNDFTNDFRKRCLFAGIISVIYNIDIFGLKLDWHTGYEILWKKLIEFINDISLPMTIRKVFYDGDIYPIKDNWTFSNYAKKLDTSILQEFLAPHVDRKFCREATRIFVYPEIEKANWYLLFLSIFETLEKNLDNLCGYSDEKKAEFVFLIYTLRRMVPYTSWKLKDLKSCVESIIHE